MTVETYEFQQSSEGGRERMVPIPWTRLTDATPTKAEISWMACNRPSASPRWASMIFVDLKPTSTKPRAITGKSTAIAGCS